MIFLITRLIIGSIDYLKMTHIPTKSKLSYFEHCVNPFVSNVMFISIISLELILEIIVLLAIL